MTAEELLKSAGVCCHMPVCHTPCQIKPAACRAGTATVCCILSLAGSYSPGLGGRLQFALQAGMLFSPVVFHVRLYWLVPLCPRDRFQIIIVIFQSPGFNKMYLL